MNRHWLSRQARCLVLLALAGMGAQTVVRSDKNQENGARFQVGDLYGDLAAADAAAHGAQSHYLRYARGGRIDILVVTAIGKGEALTAWLSTVGGEVLFREEAIGYVRASVPVRRWREARGLPGVEAVAIDGLKVGTGDWTEMPNLFYVWRLSADGRARPRWSAATAGTPAKPPDAEPTVDERWIEQEVVRRDALLGIDRLQREHSTFDGRGVTVAVFEEGGTRLAWSHPSLQRALTLDGRPIRKIHDVDVSEFWGRVTPQASFETTERAAFVNGEPYELPEPGKYRLGSLEVDHRTYEVVWQSSTRRTWIDLNNDAVFGPHEMLEDPLGAPQGLPSGAQLLRPLPSNFGAEVIATHRDGGASVAVIPSGSPHSTMTGGLIAASGASPIVRTGIAPGARLVLGEPRGDLAHDVLEGLIRLARRRDVDIINVSSTTVASVPPDPDNVTGLVVDRLVTIYDTLIVLGAGNAYADESAHGWRYGLSVGALLDEGTARTYFGAESADRVWPYSQRGPSLLGLVKPDVLGLAGPVGIRPCDGPQTIRARVSFARCYGATAGTSAAAPSIAGLAAILVSGAKQQQLEMSARDLRNAILESGRSLPGAQAGAQGYGVPQADVAWRILTRRPSVPRIVSRGGLAHVLQAYVPEDNREGLYEREGWSSGERGRRYIALRRETGEKGPESFRLEWRANDGSFSAPDSVVLPLDEWVRVPIAIDAGESGPHNALLSVSTKQGALAHTLPIGIVVADSLSPSTFTREYSGTLGPLARVDRAFRVPRGVSELHVSIELSGATYVSFGEPAGWQYHRYPIRQANSAQPLTGTQEFVIPDPDDGTWILSLSDGSDDAAGVSYRVRLTAYGATLNRAGRRNAGKARLSVSNRFAPVANAQVLFEAGRRYERTGRFDAAGNPLAFDVTVPKDAPFLQLRAGTRKGGAVHMYVYDCTRDCYRFDAIIPARREALSRIDRPAAGVWRAVLTPGPGMSHDDDVSVEWVVGTNEGEQPIPRRAFPVDLTTGNASVEPVPQPLDQSTVDGGWTWVARVTFGLTEQPARESQTTGARGNRLSASSQAYTVAPRAKELRSSGTRALH